MKKYSIKLFKNIVSNGTFILSTQLMIMTSGTICANRRLRANRRDGKKNKLVNRPADTRPGT